MVVGRYLAVRKRPWLLLFSGTTGLVVVLAVLLGVGLIGVMGAPSASSASDSSTCGAGSTPNDTYLPAGVTGTVGGLTAEQLNNARTIAGVAIAAKLGKIGIRIAMVTAYTEATLVSVNYGDTMNGSMTSSRGLFQQMDPWGPLDVRLDPAGATSLFINGGQGGQPGLLDIPNWWTLDPWVAAQAVEQSQFSDGSNYRGNLAVTDAIVESLLAGQTVPELPDPAITSGQMVSASAATSSPGAPMVTGGAAVRRPAQQCQAVAAAGAAPSIAGAGTVQACTSQADLADRILAAPNLKLREGREASQANDIRTQLQCNTLAAIASMLTLGVEIRLNSLKSDHGVDGGYHPKGLGMDLGYLAGDPVGAQVYEFLYRNYLALNVIQIIWMYPPTIDGIDPGAKCIQQNVNGIAATHGVLGDCDALYPSDIADHADHIHMAVHL